MKLKFLGFLTKKKCGGFAVIFLDFFEDFRFILSYLFDEFIVGFGRPNCLLAIIYGEKRKAAIGEYKKGSYSKLCIFDFSCL